MDEILEGGRVLWSERPLQPTSWSKYVGDDGVGRIFYYDRTRNTDMQGAVT